jgi:hypothetical protein
VRFGHQVRPAGARNGCGAAHIFSLAGPALGARFGERIGGRFREEIVDHMAADLREGLRNRLTHR